VLLLVQIAPVGIYKRRVGAELITGRDRMGASSAEENTSTSDSDSGPRKFVVPAKRTGGKMEGDSMRGKRGKLLVLLLSGVGVGVGVGIDANLVVVDDITTVRVTNLSEDTVEEDLDDLFRKYGPISRIYLAKEKHTGRSKGFAFINFVRREDAQDAIDALSGVGFDHVILHLEWAKPSTREG
jgi:translation initiation factor 3 subunit G